MKETRAHFSFSENKVIGGERRASSRRSAKLLWEILSEVLIVFSHRNVDSLLTLLIQLECSLIPFLPTSYSM